jgi:AcrR family transcriptional regulator
MTHRLTNKGEQTRARIIAGAAAETRWRGVHQVRLDDVIERAGISKSQLFRYFPAGKQQLLLAVARYEADNPLPTDRQPTLGNLTTWAAWQAGRDRLVERYRAQGAPCEIGSVLEHTVARESAAQAVVAVRMEWWRRSLAGGIRQMQSTGDISPVLDPDQTAAAVLAGIQGGVIAVLNSGRVEYLEAILDLMISRLRSA